MRETMEDQMKIIEKAIKEGRTALLWIRVILLEIALNIRLRPNEGEGNL
jgi:hypothetical protein